MPRTVMTFTNPILRVADTEAGLSTGMAIECQVTSALVQAQPTYNQIAATGCAPAAQSPGSTGWQLVLNWLQDWTKGDDPLTGSFSFWAFEHDADQVWFELIPTGTDTTTKISGNGFAVAGDFGGTFGDGSAGVATATWPLLAKPTVAVPDLTP